MLNPDVTWVCLLRFVSWLSIFYTTELRDILGFVYETFFLNVQEEQLGTPTLSGILLYTTK